MPIQLDIRNMHKFSISVVMSGAFNFNTESWPVKVDRLLAGPDNSLAII